MTYYLAIDIGASSGRHILGYLEDGKLKTEEIYRFDNGYTNSGGSLVWNIDSLINEVKLGIKKCSQLNKIPKTVAIDTWGVDYVLLDEKNNEILPAYCYRDGRTQNTVAEVEKIVSQEEMYEKTGIQKQAFNTVYQLFSDKLSGKLNNAKNFLMIPEYISFKLTGVIKKEYTNATTTGLVNAREKTWDKDIINRLSLPEHLFTELSLPGTEVGHFTEEMKAFAGFDSTVIFAPSHDTASAVAATPMNGDDLYISSGTWSLIGIESQTPIINSDTKAANFTNEGGFDYRFRFLKNYMGMWLLQNIRKNINKLLTYDEMMNLAKSSKEFSFIDVNSDMFVAPENMIEAIRTYLNMPKAEISYVIASVYHSLAKSYKDALCEITKISGKTVNAIHIVGGGSHDTYLNELTSQYTGKVVTAGPFEATAVGNLISQLIFDKVCDGLQSARNLISKSFNITEV